MSNFNICEICSQLAQAVCECSSPPRFFCELHISDHSRSGGTHRFRNVFFPISSLEISQLRQASEQYQRESIRGAILRRNKRSEELLIKLKEIEEDCLREIEGILSERSKIEEVCALGGLPVFSHNPLFSSLIYLRCSSVFFFQDILKQLFSLHYSLPSLPSSLPTLSSSLQSPFPPQWELFREFQAHDKPILSVAVSDCERYLASGSQDKTIKIWDLNTLECIYTLIGHTKWVRSVVFWRNKVISGSGDQAIKIWEGDRCLNTLTLHSDKVLTVCTSYCKGLLVSGGGDKRVVVYNLQEKRILHYLLSHSNAINSVVFSPSNEQIVSESKDRSIKIWNTDTGELLKTLYGHSNAITCVCFWGTSLVSSSCDNKIKVWNIKEEVVETTLNGHSSSVIRVEGNDLILCSLGKDNSLRVWERRNGECIQTLDGHGDYSQDKNWHPMGLKLLRRGDYIISGGRDKKIKIFKRIS